MAAHGSSIAALQSSLTTGLSNKADQSAFDKHPGRRGPEAVQLQHHGGHERLHRLGQQRHAGHGGRQLRPQDGGGPALPGHSGEDHAAGGRHQRAWLTEAVRRQAPSTSARALSRWWATLSGMSPWTSRTARPHLSSQATSTWTILCSPATPTLGPCRGRLPHSPPSELASRDASISGLQASKADASALTAYALQSTVDTSSEVDSKIAAALLDAVTTAALDAALLHKADASALALLSTDWTRHWR